LLLICPAADRQFIIAFISCQKCTSNQPFVIGFSGEEEILYYYSWKVCRGLLGYMVGPYSSFFSGASRLLSNRDRANVEGLIKHVPDARYKGFSSHAAAAQHYFDAKKSHNVKIVRDPGDELKYGPMFSAVQ
jgi:hypothetical protein